VDGYEARIVNEDNGDVGVGEIGNLLVSGDSTCACYWNKHDKTKTTIEGRWIRTGDKYYQDADGYYWYAGRSDDMMKVGGIWVSPIEVENALIEHPAVQECGVGSRADHDGLPKPYAFVVLKNGKAGTPELAT
jgi:benzoate-CoA ligase